MELINSVFDFIKQIFPYILVFTTPILITAFGGMFSERSGVVNIGLEGLMIVGTFSAAFVNYLFGGFIPQYLVWISILVAALFGGLLSLLHAYASITLKADQVISGTAINVLASALTVFLAEGITTTQNIQVFSALKRYPTLGFLSNIPILGDLFFTKAYLSTFFVLIIVFISWFVLFKTSYGLRLRACGEYPQAADSMGINVVKMRYQAVFISGIFSGIGGAIFLLTISREFTGFIGGFGFLALASLIFGKWKPLNVIFATLFFGGMSTLAQFSSVNDTIKSLNLPRETYNILPYVLTLVALLFFARNAAAPKALGEPYDAGKR